MARRIKPTVISRKEIAPAISASKWEYWKRTAASPEYAADSMKVLHAGGKVTRMRYLEMMYQLDEKYPGKGWKEQADELSFWYTEHGMKLSEYPNVEESVVDEVVRKPPFNLFGLREGRAEK